MAKKKHHFIPVFYLKGFVDPRDGENVWVYEKGGIEIRKSRPENTGYIKYYHAFKKEGGWDTDTIENFLEKTESKVSPIINKLEGKEELSLDERWMFSYFLALMMVRVPNFRNNVENVMADIIKDVFMNLARDKDRFHASIRSYEIETGESLGDPEELRQFTLSDRYTVKANPQLSLSMFLKGPAGYANIFNAMTWLFLEATDNFKFITSDNPLFYDDPSRDPNSVLGVGLADKNIELTFPVTRNLGLLATWGKSHAAYIKKTEFVKMTNRRTAVAAQRFVYASEKSDGIDRMVQKCKNSSPKIRMI